eukprot:11675938-Alexandrium_andersonii.AAC.1
MSDRERYDSAVALMGPSMEVPRVLPLLRALAELLGVDASGVPTQELLGQVHGAFVDLRSRPPAGAPAGTPQAEATDLE